MTKKDKKIIEDSEARGIPIFVMTAKDFISVSTIQHYRTLCKAEECGIDHLKEISERIDEFRAWQVAHPGQVKLPD
jgi:hypothetical protein